jgi:hypothetical protein
VNLGKEFGEDLRGTQPGILENRKGEKGFTFCDLVIWEIFKRNSKWVRAEQEKDGLPVYTPRT